MSDSVRPHRWQPTRLRHPWDSPGKKTGVGCHFLLQHMKGKSESEVAQSCPTLCDPMNYSPPSSSIHGIFQARVLEWGAIVFSNLIPTYAKILVLTPPYGFFFSVQIFISSVTSFIGHFLFLLHKVHLFILFTKIMSSGTLLCI